MELSGIQIGLDMLISIIFGASGAVGVWFKMKGKQDLQAVAINSLEKDQDEDSKRFDNEINKLRESKRELNRQLHERIDGIKRTVERNREHAEQSNKDMKQFINDMKVEIIREIHTSKS